MNTADGELEALFNRLADGIHSQADEKRLAELLRTGPEARRAYREFMELLQALLPVFCAQSAQNAPNMNMTNPTLASSSTTDSSSLTRVSRSLT